MKAGRIVSSLLAAAALCLAAAGTRAAEPFSLGGHTLGLPYDSVLDDPAYDCESLAGCFLFSACAYKTTGPVAFKGAPIDGLTLYFTGERLSGISAGFQESGFDQVAEALAQEYGPGTIEAGKVDVGATSSSAVLVWRQGSKLLRLERSSKAGRSSVIVAERSFISELVEP
ncbi:MAG TPA: hypothetical protein VGR01_16225 [Burkholderiales bacterium]|jgi:hypothetical protein|nr:hypothetical protein [Burkholderiales bacterium]